MQALLLSGFLLSLICGFFIQPILAPNDFLILLFSFALPVIGWYLLKPTLLKNKEAKQSLHELVHFKYNTEIFEALLLKQKLAIDVPATLGITLGNPDAANTIKKHSL